MAQHGPHSLGSTQEIHGHISERIQGLLRECCDYNIEEITDVSSSLETVLVVTTRVTTGSAVVSMMS